MTISISVPVELIPFSVPNYAVVEAGGNGESRSIAIGELTAEALGSLCDRFRADIFEKAGKRDIAKPQIRGGGLL